MQLTPWYAGSMDGSLCIGAIDDVGEGAMPGLQDGTELLAFLSDRLNCRPNGIKKYFDALGILRCEPYVSRGELTTDEEFALDLDVASIIAAVELRGRCAYRE